MARIIKYYDPNDDVVSYTLYHTGKCGVVRKEQTFKTLNGLERAYERAIENSQKYAYNRDDLKLHDPIVKITAIKWQGIFPVKTLHEFRP